MKKTILLLFLILFGLVTLFMSSSVLFDWFGIRAKEGNYVSLVVWANFLCGILYLIAAFGIIRNKSWVRIPFVAALIVLVLAYMNLFTHITTGGLYETKTIFAMAFRFGITALFLFTTIKILKI